MHSPKQPKFGILLFFFMHVLVSIVTANDKNSQAVDSDSILLRDDWVFMFLGTDTNNALLKRSLQDSSFAKIQVPHSYNLNETMRNHREGFGLYSRMITVPRQSSGKNIVLCFDGICLRANVYINSIFVGKSAHAYLPFLIDISKYVQPGKTFRLSVIVDNRLQKDDIPDINGKGWWIYGGINREVHMIAKDINRLVNLTIRTLYVNNDTFNLAVDFTYKGIQPDSVILDITTPSGNPFFRSNIKTASPGNHASFHLHIPQPWTPDSPSLYLIHVIPYYNEKSGKPVTVHRGFVQLTTNSNKLLLNGNPIFLRGIGRHDVIDNKGPLLSRQERLQDLLDIKELGCNFLRVAHYPQHRDVYELCDSLGIIVMDEIPAWKTNAGFLVSDSGKTLAEDYMRKLIERHGNHTCIALWSIGNEFNTLRTDVAEYVNTLSVFVKTSDPSRLVTYCNYLYQFDKAYGYVDVISINEYFGWYLGSIAMLTPMLEQIHKQWPDKPVIITETGAQAGLGIRNQNPRLAGMAKSLFVKDLSEDHQALFAKSQIDTLWAHRDICNGVVIWCYNDFMAPRDKPKEEYMPWGLNCMGLVDGERKRKKGFEAVRERFEEMGNSTTSKIKTLH